MNDGILLCSRFAYPPNALHLCGPQKQADLAYISASGIQTSQTKELLTQFKTLYPYLQIIAQDNGIKDPFDSRVVEAYWIGNSLLQNVKKNTLITHIQETLRVKKMLSQSKMYMLNTKLFQWGLPFHAFHVLHVYPRTGHVHDVHTVATMDACIINWGRIVEKKQESIIVLTKPLVQTESGIQFGPLKQREIMHAGILDTLSLQLSVGDYITYHWGKFCTRITRIQQKRLETYTLYAIKAAQRI